MSRRDSTAAPESRSLSAGAPLLVERALLHPSPLNPRKHFPAAALESLAASLREVGILQPLVVREAPKGQYEIVCGECRWRAAELAELAQVPVTVRELTDTQVIEIALMENIQRKNLTPLEEARGYRALIDSAPTKHSAESIATRVGMSPAWVWDRLKLNDLTAEAKTILEQERMTIAHAILIARLKPEDQARVIHPGAGRNVFHHEGLWAHESGRLDDDDPKKSGKYDGLKAVSVRELDAWIKDHVRFDIEHAAKAQPLQFESIAAAVEEAAAASGRGKKVVAITRSYRVKDDARDETDRTYGSEAWIRADGEGKSKQCEHSVLGVFVAGEGQGDTLRVCVARDKCLVHFGSIVRAKQKAAKQREAGQTKKADRTESAAAAREEHDWKKQQQARDAAAKAWNAVKPEACRLIREHLRTVKFGVRLVEIAFEGGGGELPRLRDIQAEFGVSLTPKTAALVLALGTINAWDLVSFVAAVKPWKFDVKPVKALIAAQLKPSGDKATTDAKGKKPTKKAAA